MASSKTARARKVKSRIIKIKQTFAFSLLELLLSVSLSLVLVLMLSEIFIINYKTTVKTEKYNKALLVEQYLYWFFYNQITENIGINNFDEISNNKKTKDLENILKQLITANNTAKVKIFSSTDEVVKQKLPQQARARLAINANILLINSLNIIDNYLKVDESLYYIASVADQKQQKSDLYALYQYRNNQSEELVRGVEDMGVKKIIKNTKQYYVFRFRGYDDFNKFSFVVAESKKAHI